MPMRHIPAQIVAQRAAAVYRANALAVAILYFAYGLNFIFAASRTSFILYGGVLTSPIFWGCLFTFTGGISIISVLFPTRRAIYQVSQIALPSLTTAWIITRLAIVTQSGLDLTAPLVWFVLLVSIVGRLYLTQDVGKMPLPSWINRGIQWLLRLPHPHANEEETP